ncbi:MAG: sugar phosphate isomerase/epimerase [Eubacteriales bacterium]|nr:sugar phosphate isomerase/epimerase [Clostridia bacterium]MDY2846529.1 sugar phosphate isomerase/epimerase [Eubacteriales bacterium]
MKIGAMVESFRLGFKNGVEKAASLGIEGIQAYATGGELGVDDITDAKLKEALDIVKSNGLVFSAICGDFGHGFMNPEQNKIYVEKSKRVLDLAKKLECNIVTTHIGTVPAEENETKEIMRKACRELAEYADSVGSAFAVETGPEPGKVLGEFLDSLGAGGVRVNFDPANLVMCVDDRPENALKYLGKYVVHTHAKDGIMLKKKIEEKINIGEEAKEHQALADMGMKYLELPLGEGDVNFDVYLPALAATGFNGFLTIEREVGDNPEKDIALAVEFLKEKIKKFNLG